jgi:hypothetical protein
MYNLQDKKHNLSWPPQNYCKKYLLKEIEAKKQLVRLLLKDKLSRVKKGKDMFQNTEVDSWKVECIRRNFVLCNQEIND